MEDGLSCPACGGAVAQPTPHCPHCGERMLLTTESRDTDTETDTDTWAPDPNNPDDLKSTFVRQPKAIAPKRAQGPLTDETLEPVKEATKSPPMWLGLLVGAGILAIILWATGII